MSKKPSENISEFLNFVAEARTQHKIYSDEVIKQDKLTQDYLHSLELDGLKCNERSKIATKLVTNRKDRRYFKSRVEELEPIVKLFEDPHAQKLLNQLTQTLGQTRKMESYHKHGKYVPKILKEKNDE
jgi:hypothetical protein